MENNHKPAFPAVEGSTAFYEPGLSKREWLAGMALQGILSNPQLDIATTKMEIIARDAGALADTLLLELSKPQP